MATKITFKTKPIKKRNEGEDNYNSTSPILSSDSDQLFARDSEIKRRKMARNILDW